jgi:HAD superfamily hydrolase (TIGR01509 family)
MGNVGVRKLTRSQLSVLEHNSFAAVLWDWDGVLVDSGYNFYHAYEMVLRDEGIVTSPREIYLREGEPTPRLLKAIFDQHHVPVDDAKIGELVVRRREYDAGLAERKLFPSVPRLVHRLREAGCQVGIVTGSSRRSLDRVLTEAQARWFDVIITADDALRGKPDPEPFLLATRALRIKPEKCVVIENAPFGIEAARAAGCAVAAICTTLPKADLVQAKWVVKDHKELEVLLFGSTVQDAAEKMSAVSGDSP